MNLNGHSSYYQAFIKKDGCGFLVSVLRSFEHLVFDRTLEKSTNHFEFFVPQGNEETFLALMDFFTSEGIVLKLEKKPNRLSDPHEPV